MLDVLDVFGVCKRAATVHAMDSNALPDNAIAQTPRWLVGVDFSSAPTQRKPITMALGERRGQVLRLQSLHSLATHEALVQALAEMPAWLGAFDFPFGLPRELIEALGWPREWSALIAHYSALSRADIRAAFAGFCNARPSGAKFVHRATDIPAGASPSMKWVNPPVAYMLHAGVPLLLHVGADLPGLHAGDAARVALEGYPGMLARELIERRSYKSDAAAKQTPERLIARKDLVEALEQGRSRIGLRLKLSHAQRDQLVADARGDLLDAVLCLMQSGWAASRADFGRPADADRLEGWIVSADLYA